MEFTLNTTELQHIVIALIHVESSCKEEFAYNPQILENIRKVRGLFGSINAETLEEHEYTATFNVTF